VFIDPQEEHTPRESDPREEHGQFDSWEEHTTGESESREEHTLQYSRGISSNVNNLIWRIWVGGKFQKKLRWLKRAKKPGVENLMSVSL